MQTSKKHQKNARPATLAEVHASKRRSIEKRLGTKKRRLPNFRLQELGAPTPLLSDDAIDRIIKAVSCPISTEGKEILKTSLLDVFEWHEILAIKAPARWEVDERLSLIQSSAEKLWQSLGVTREPNEIGDHLRTVDIESALHGPLHDAADKWGQEYEQELHRKKAIPHELALFGSGNLYFSHRLQDVLYALAMLIGWVKAARFQSTSTKLNDSVRRKPDHLQLGITSYLALTYEQAFGSPPTDTAKGPWLKFLRACILELTGKNLTEGALRTRWRSAKKFSRPNLNTHTLRAFWQRAKELRTLASRESI
jgi:hypothetical protein